MTLPSQFAVFAVIYLSVTVPFAIWGLVVFSQWSRMDPAKPSLAASCYLPWMLRANGDAQVPMAPAPLDIARAVALTLTPVVNFAAFGPAGLLLLMELADKAVGWLYDRMVALCDWIAARLSTYPAVQRLNRWARRPVSQVSPLID